MESICDKLYKKDSKPVDHVYSNLPKTAGMYMLEEKLRNGREQPLYVGQTNNLKRRIGEHLRGDEQAIDRKLAKLDPNNIRVKYERMGVLNARNHEQKYIECMEQEIGKPLPFNLIKGISMKENRKQGDKVKKTSKTKTPMKAKERKRRAKK